MWQRLLLRLLAVVLVWFSNIGLCFLFQNLLANVSNPTSSKRPNIKDANSFKKWLPDSKCVQFIQLSALLGHFVTLCAKSPFITVFSTSVQHQCYPSGKGSAVAWNKALPFFFVVHTGIYWVLQHSRGSERIWSASTAAQHINKDRVSSLFKRCYCVRGNYNTDIDFFLMWETKGKKLSKGYNRRVGWKEEMRLNEKKD